MRSYAQASNYSATNKSIGEVRLRPTCKTGRNQQLCAPRLQHFPARAECPGKQWLAFLSADVPSALCVVGNVAQLS
jgi:hypothetical protein